MPPLAPTIMPPPPAPQPHPVATISSPTALTCFPIRWWWWRWWWWWSCSCSWSCFFWTSHIFGTMPSTVQSIVLHHPHPAKMIFPIEFFAVEFIFALNSCQNHLGRPGQPQMKEEVLSTHSSQPITNTQIHKYANTQNMHKYQIT